MIVSNNIYKFSSFPQNIIQGISTRFFGSMKDQSGFYKENINSFCKAIGINSKTLVTVEQKHSSNIYEVTEIKAKIPQNMDGLLTKIGNIFLGIVTADCLPIFFFDSKKNIVGVIHAGYKGILNGVIENMLKKFGTTKEEMESILVGIGPGIGVCCYNVPVDRIKAFKNRFPQFTEIFEKRNSQFFLNMQSIAIQILNQHGIPLVNIESVDICTKDNLDTFFSFRGNTKETFGEFISIIGFK